jgi:hypothetical protein
LIGESEAPKREYIPQVDVEMISAGRDEGSSARPHRSECGIFG